MNKLLWPVISAVALTLLARAAMAEEPKDLSGDYACVGTSDNGRTYT